MKIRALDIRGFRGIKEARLVFSDHDVIIGPNGAGKSTIIDGLSLIFGRSQLVRELTEHDFFGSDPGPSSRIKLVVTLTGLGDDPGERPEWFRMGRAVPKWWNATAQQVEPQPSKEAAELCVQVGFAARFERQELSVETVRFFHDDDEVQDPFQADVVELPFGLLREIGFYVLPVRRTWEGNASFASDLFRKAIAATGAIPAEPILRERDRLRSPDQPLESEDALRPLIDGINEELAQLLPHAPRFQLRVTGTDSDALLRALVPHYQVSDAQPALPAARHGTGLLALQLFFLLLEIGRARVRNGLPFILAMEEPELHVPPGLQRRLIAQAMSVARQTICTSHAPRIASFYQATSIRILSNDEGRLRATPLLEQPLTKDARQCERKLYLDERTRVVEALMQVSILVPEGRSELEWLRLLSDVVETSEHVAAANGSGTPPFGSVVGVVPPHNGAVAAVYGCLRRLRPGVATLVDGDQGGDDKLRELVACDPPPDRVLQWPRGWTIENVLGWILQPDEARALRELRARLGQEFSSVSQLADEFRVKGKKGRLGTDYVAYEEVAAFIREEARLVARARDVLDWVTQACLGRDGPHVERFSGVRGLVVTRFKP